MANPAPDTREDAAPSEPPLISTTWCPWMDTSVPGTCEDAAPAELPDIPKEFGQDNGEFYRHYDALAEKLDDNMVKSLKEQLDGLLLFAGLFAGVNSTILALTLPLLSADPADDTNALLRENNAILLQLALNRTDSLPIASPLPSESFSVSGRILTVNILFSISLALALVSSLFAVLGRQWLIEYRSHSGSGADNQRRERISRYLGVRGWGLEWLLGDLLPTVLQIALILFGISLTIYINTLHSTVAKIVGAFLGAGMGSLVCMAIFAIWDPYCPFQTPFSRMITYIVPATFRWTIMVVTFGVLAAVGLALVPLGLIGYSFFAIGADAYMTIKGRDQHITRTVRGFAINIRETLRGFVLWFMRRVLPRIVPSVQYGKRKGVAFTTSQVEAVSRVICYSDDPAALMNAISNLLCIWDGRALLKVATDDQFGHALSQLCRTSHTDALHRQDPDQTDLATAVTWRYRAAMAHVALFSSRSYGWKKNSWVRRSFGDKPELAIPPDLIKAASPVLIDHYLGYVALIAITNPDARRTLRRTVKEEFEGLIDSSWRRISIIIACLMSSCTRCAWNEKDVRHGFKGEPSTVLENISVVLHKCRDPLCNAHIPSYKYLVEIFKSIRKATINSSGQWTIEIHPMAKLLHVSEGFLRIQECPAEFSPVARGLRKDLIDGLRLKLEENTNPGYRNRAFAIVLQKLDALMVGRWVWIYSPVRQMLMGLDASVLDLMGTEMPQSWWPTLYTLSLVFSDVTAVDNRLTIFSKVDDLELADLFRPVLQSLDELPPRFKRQVRRLRREFENFTSIANTEARSRDRDSSTDDVTDARNAVGIRGYSFSQDLV